MRRSLVIQTSFIGDMVLTTPLITELASRGPVDVVATPVSAGLLANHPHVRHVFRYDKRRGRLDTGEATHSRVGFFAVARLARAGRDDTAYLAQGSLRSAALARVAGYRERVGFDTSAGRLLYTSTRRYRADVHHAERLWRLAMPEGSPVPAGGLRPRLYPGPVEDEAVQLVLDAAGHAGEPLVGLAPGSVWATKRWPYYAALAQRLTTLGRVVVIGSGDDTPLAEEIVRETFGSAIDATGRLSLLASTALIARCRVLVTNDSAPQHLASAVNTPTISLFGPTVPAFGFGPLAAHSRIAEVHMLACRPCDRHGPRRCPLGHWRCMRDLTVSEVAELVGIAGTDAGVEV